MKRKPSKSKSLLITTIVGTAFAGVVVAGVLVPLKLMGLLPPHYSWLLVVALPFLCFYLLSGIVVTSLVSNSLGYRPLSAKSVLISFAYLGIMVLAIVAILTFS